MKLKKFLIKMEVLNRDEIPEILKNSEFYRNQDQGQDQGQDEESED